MTAKALPGSTFCYRVKRWRAYLGVTQRRFAELWGVSASLVQKIEADDYSVSQLSFERLEALRTLLKLSSATFYGLISTQPDVPETGAEGGVSVRRLEPGLAPISLPQTLLGHVAATSPLAASLCAFRVASGDFAPDRLRDRLRVGALVVVDTSGSPADAELTVSRYRNCDQEHRVLHGSDVALSATPVFLHSFDPASDAVLAPQGFELEPLGVVIGYWVGLNV